MALIGNETLTLRQYGSGSADSGRFNPGPFSDSSLPNTSVRPSSGKELQTLPEGERQREAYTIRTFTEVRTGEERESRLADRVLYRDLWFEVRHVWPSQSGIISHHRALIVRLDRQPSTAHSSGYNKGHA